MLFGAVAAAALLAACGGGGAPALPTTAPPVGGPGNPAVSSSARPAAIGDTFAFSGSSQESDVYTYPVGSPFPSTATAAKISENVVVTASSDPLGIGGTDFHSTTTTVGTSATRTESGDSYYSTLSAGSGTNFVLNAQQSVDDSKNAYTWTYTTPQILDELPESAGATWTNSPAGTYSESDADGARVARTTNADGSYNETDTFATGGVPSMQFNVQPDGSGAWDLDFLGAPAPSMILLYSAPTAGTISVSVLNPTPAPSPGATGTPAPNPPILIATPAAWFSPSPKLYQESDTVSTGASFPASCAVPSAFGTSGNSIAQVVTKIDPIFGLDEVTLWIKECLLNPWLIKPCVFRMLVNTLNVESVLNLDTGAISIMLSLSFVLGVESRFCPSHINALNRILRIFFLKAFKVSNALCSPLFKNTTGFFITDLTSRFAIGSWICRLMGNKL